MPGLIALEVQVGCHNLTCPGHLRCKDSHICVNRRHFCDGRTQCRPYGEDELLCERQCSDGCLCLARFTSCDDQQLHSVPQASNLTKALFLYNNNILLTKFSSFDQLLILDMSSNGIKFIPVSVFSEFSHLIWLDLSGNKITNVSRTTFEGLVNVRGINLQGNPVTTLFPWFLNGLKMLRIVNLHALRIQTILNDAFQGSPEHFGLNLSDNKLLGLDKYTFQGLTNVTFLDLRGNLLLSVHQHTFDIINHIWNLFVDEQTICCLVDQEVSCHSKNSVSCQSLLHDMPFKTVSCAIGFTIIVSNIVVIIKENKQLLDIEHYHRKPRKPGSHMCCSLTCLWQTCFLGCTWLDLPLQIASTRMHCINGKEALVVKLLVSQGQSLLSYLCL